MFSGNLINCDYSNSINRVNFLHSKIRQYISSNFILQGDGLNSKYMEFAVCFVFFSYSFQFPPAVQSNKKAVKHLMREMCHRQRKLILNHDSLSRLGFQSTLIVILVDAVQYAVLYVFIHLLLQLYDNMLSKNDLQ